MEITLKVKIRKLIIRKVVLALNKVKCSKEMMISSTIKKINEAKRKSKLEFLFLVTDSLSVNFRCYLLETVVALDLVTTL